MTWFKVDDTFGGHPKVRAAGLEAVGLWTVAGTWCGQQLTDGFVPGWFAETWPRGRRLAAALVAAGLWVEVDGGWLFHEWEQCNPTRAEVEEKRANDRERQKRSRESRAVSRVTRVDGHSAPTRPDPLTPRGKPVDNPRPLPPPVENILAGRPDRDDESNKQRLAAVRGVLNEKGVA